MNVNNKISLLSNYLDVFVGVVVVAYATATAAADTTDAVNIIVNVFLSIFFFFLYFDPGMSLTFSRGSFSHKIKVHNKKKILFLVNMLFESLKLYSFIKKKSFFFYFNSNYQYLVKAIISSTIYKKNFFYGFSFKICKNGIKFILFYFMGLNVIIFELLKKKSLKIF